MSAPKEEDRTEFLAFKRALESEHQQRLRDAEMQLDEELGEIVSLRRVEVEKEVSRRRETQQERARALRESLKMELLRDLRQQLAREVQEILSSLESQVFEELQDLRGGIRYEQALCRLAQEGLSMVGDRVQIFVGQGDGKKLHLSGGEVLVDETGDFPDGGCLVVRYPEGNHLVDNSLRSRWKHLVRELSKEISHRVTPFFDQLEEVL